MTQLTIRGIDNELRAKLDDEALRRRLSLNRCVVAILAESLGVVPKTHEEDVLFTDLDHLAGTWSEDEASAFDASLAEQRQVDEELWR